MAELIQTVCAIVLAADVRVTVLFGVTAMVPVVVNTPQPPVKLTVYVLAEPATVGVPLIVKILFDHELLTPEGKLVTLAPVATVVA